MSLSKPTAADFQGVQAYLIQLYNYVTNLSGGDVVFSDAPNESFDVSETTPVTIISKSVTDISAGDQVQLDVWYTILNNSGNARNYTGLTALGSLSISSAASATIASNAGNRRTERLTVQFSVSAANLAYAQASLIASASAASDTPSDLDTAVSKQTWDTTTSDLTGTQTLTFTMNSSNATATQTLILHSYKITKISTQ